MADDRKPDESVEERRKRRIEEARAKLKAKQAVEAGAPATDADAGATSEKRGPGTVSASAEGLIEPGARPAGERPEDVKAMPEGPGGSVESTVEPAPPAGETPEQKRARRIAEARAKLKASGGTPASEQGAAETLAAPLAAETPEQKRARRIAEARTKLKGAAAPPPADVRPAAAKKVKGGVETSDISGDPLVVALRERVGGGLLAAISMVGQRIVTVARAAQPGALRFLRDDARASFDLLLDVTAVHRPEEEPPFEVVYQLCSTSTRARLRVKVPLEDGEPVPTATSVWSTANWLEREAYDMFGIVFEGHPDLRRILLPEGWEGHPLRKEYPVEFRENRWTRENLNIVELPADADFTGKLEV
jgi:NADH-quinone oxidoreductase subunit C